MADERSLVDCNVLVYTLFEDAEHHAASLALLDRAQTEGLALCVASQVLAEFYAVITDPRRVTNPYEAGAAIEAVNRVLAMPNVTMLPTPSDLVNRWTDLARRHPVTRGAIFDLQLVATMLANGVVRIYTFNCAHFERFSELMVLTP